jgi:hypothetical protein
MGGFAKHVLAQGSHIVPMPLALIADRDILTMYKMNGGDTEEIEDKQLLLNYCLGHGDSKLLFCPLTNAILVNHCSTRRSWDGQCGKDGPNAAYRWAKEFDPMTSISLDMTLEEISKVRDVYVAITRDLSTEEALVFCFVSASYRLFACLFRWKAEASL